MKKPAAQPQTTGELLVIGHRNPDTDSICAAIAYAEFKRRTGTPHAVAARCGDTNARIDFVLERFGVPAPRFVADVSPKVRDVMQRDVVSVSPEATLLEALNIMDEKTIRVLPVLDAHRVCRGLVSVFKISKFFCPPRQRLVMSRRVFTSTNTLIRTLEATPLTTTDADREQELFIVVAAMTDHAFAERLRQFQAENILLIVGDRQEIQLQAIAAGARVIVVTGGLNVAPSIQEQARAKGVSLLVSPHDTITTATLARSSMMVKHMVHTHFLSFSEDQLLEEIRSVAASSTFQAFPVLNDSGQTIGILSKTDFLKKVERELILVDHNELSQAVAGAQASQIVEIIDHHRIGALTTHHPILFRNEPVGSTSTIVADCFFRNQVELPPAIAGLLLAGLITDTLNLTSPTSTPHDEEILRRLERTAGVDAAEFTEKLFASGSVLTSLPPEKAIVADCKEFQDHGRTFSVAQIEELGFANFWKNKDDVMAALRDYKANKGYFFSALLVTDVVRTTSLLLVAAPALFLKQIDHPMVEKGVYTLEGVVSRKKQLLPYLTHCLGATPPAA